MYLLSTFFKQDFLLDASIYNIRTIRKKTYLFFDNVHLIKNICNYLLNCKKIVFPAFSFSFNDQLLASSENGYISWRDFHDLNEEDTKQKAILRMAPKITAGALHPRNNKQKVALALAIFHETTIAAFKIYKLARKDAVDFLTVLSSWWAMINSKQRYNLNALGNAIISSYAKIDFFLFFAKWLENWSFSAGSIFCLSKQTSSALIYTLRFQSQLINDLLEEGYSYVRVGRMQSDPIERRFLQYQKMNGVIFCKFKQNYKF